MDFQKYDLGMLSAGKILEVTLGYAANVQILDSINFQKYKNGKSHSYIGGFVKTSPYKVKIPHASHWYVVIDLGGSRGKVSSSVKVLN